MKFWKFRNWFISVRPYIILPLAVLMVVYSLYILKINSNFMNSITWTNILVIFSVGAFMAFTSLIDLVNMDKLPFKIGRVFVVLWFLGAFSTILYIISKESLAEERERSVLEVNRLRAVRMAKQVALDSLLVEKKRFVDSILTVNGCRK